MSRLKGFGLGSFPGVIWGLIPIFFSIVLILVGELASVETLAYIGIWGCVVGITFSSIRPADPLPIFPLIILAFIVPLPPFVNRMLTFQLKLAASSLATLMLRVSGVSVFQDGNIIDLGSHPASGGGRLQRLEVLDTVAFIGTAGGLFFQQRVVAQSRFCFFL